LIYTQVFVGGNGSRRADIDTDTFVPGVYTCSAVCRNNQFRTLEATLYYNSRASVFCNNSGGFDNYNGGKWTASTGFVSFTSQTDGPGDTYDISIYMISGQYFAVGDDPPFPHPSTFFISSVTVNTGTPQPVTIGVSSFTGSTITMIADENISILANLTPQPYVSTGNITIAGTNVVGLIGDTTVIAGSSQIVINCDPGDVNIIATSTISLVGGSNVSIQDMILTTNNPYNWSGGTVHTLYGDVINGGKYLQWSYDNNPGTLIADNHSIQLSTPSINLNGLITANSNLDMNGNNIIANSNQLLSIGTNSPNPYPNVIEFSNYGGYLGDIKMKSYNIEIGDNQNGTIAIKSGGAGYITLGAANIWLQGTVDMCNNNINNTQTLTTSNVLVSSITGNTDINLTGLTNLNGNLDMCNNNIKTVGLFSRMLSATSVDQPILQFGEDNTGSGNTGSVVVNLPVSYTSASSYVAFASMEDSSPSEISVVRVSATSIEIYWAKGGSGSHVIAWNTMGT
jgi:hypothetical protein